MKFKDELLAILGVIIVIILAIGGWYLEYRIKVSAYKQALIEYHEAIK